MRDDPLYDMDASEETAAGFIDATRASGIVLSNRLRRELARFGLTINELLEIGVSQKAVDLTPIPEEGPDNPRDNPHYAHGWDKGMKIGLANGLSEVQRNIIDYELIVTSNYDVTTVEVVTELVGMCRFGAQPPIENPDPSMLHDDDALHAFLDETPLEPTLTVSATQEAESAEKRDRNSSFLARSLNMAKKAVNRRTMIATLVGALITGPVAWFAARSMTPTPIPSSPTTQGVYIPPTTWDNLPPEIKTPMLQLDAIAWNLEQTSGGITMISSITTSIMMGSQQTDELKAFFTKFLRTSGRDGYWAEVALGLNPANTSSDTRAELLRSMIARIKLSSPASIPQSVISAITTNPDPDPGVHALQVQLLKTAGQ